MQATITTDGKKILARIDYAQGSGPIWAKRVPNGRGVWDRSGPKPRFLHWEYPLSLDTCRAFRRVFGDELTVIVRLADWYRRELERTHSLETLREEVIEAVVLDRVEREAPELFAAVHNRSYQISGAGFILTGKHVILADDPGLGKTLQALAACIQADAREIIVACRRTATRAVWEKETKRWAPGIAVFVAQGTPTERQRAFDAYSDHPVTIPGTRKMLVINYEMIRATKTGDREVSYKYPFLFSRKWDAIVLDESHNFLASTANVGSKRITQARLGAMHLRRCLSADGIALALSGTPFRSKLEKGWGTLNWLDEDKFRSFWKWADTHFGVDKSGRFWTIGDGEKVLTPLDAESWDDMLRPFYLKRTKADAAKDLPPIVFAGTPIDPANPESPCYVQLDMEPAQAKAYAQMVRDMEVEIDGKRLTTSYVIAQLTRLRQFAIAAGTMGEGRTILPALPSNKLEWLVEFMREREDTGTKVVVASSFSAVVELAADVLRAEGFEVATLTGKTSDRDRMRLVERFQDRNGTLQVVCLNRDAGGESITLDAADDMVVLDMPWISDRDEQLNSRIHRVSRIHEVTVYRLVSTGTVDEWMAGITDAQRAAVASASPRKLSEMALSAGKEAA